MTIPTTTPLPLPGTKVANAIPELQLTAEHRLCAGCGHGCARPTLAAPAGRAHR